MQRRGKLIDEQATIKAQLAELHHCKFKLESERDIMVDFTTAWAQGMNVITTINCDGVPRLAFARANQNVAATIALLDTLPAPYVDEVDKVYRQLKEIIGITTAQQVERSLQHQAEISISSPGRSKGSRQKAAMEPQWQE
jgi:hypothetical protein